MRRTRVASDGKPRQPRRRAARSAPRRKRSGVAMARRLSEAEVERYNRDGVLFPIRVMPAADAGSLRGRLERLAAAEGGKLSRGTNHKPHLLLPWLADLVRDARVLDAVEDVLGPDILCWGSGFF